jgi:uncharacterized protein (DUF2062 family)
MESSNSVEADLWALLLCALPIAAAVGAMIVFKLREKRRARRERRRYYQEAKDERRSSEGDRRTR